MYQQNYNRQFLASILKTIVLCGRQNISLCGHLDSSTELEKDNLFPENRGNFWALFHAGDKVLSEHLATAPCNATYTSSTIQNQLIQIVGNQIRDKILDRVRRAQ